MLISKHKLGVKVNLSIYKMSAENPERKRSGNERFDHAFKDFMRRYVPNPYNTWEEFNLHIAVTSAGELLERYRHNLSCALQEDVTTREALTTLISGVGSRMLPWEAFSLGEAWADKVVEESVQKDNAQPQSGTV